MTTKTKLAELQKAALEFTAKARAAAEKAQGESREMNEDEKATYAEGMTKAGELLDQIKTVKHDLKILADAADLAKEIGQPAVDDVDAQSKSHDEVEKRLKSVGFQVVHSEAYKAMLAPYGGAGGRIPEKQRIQSDPVAVKGLVVGGDTTSAGTFVVPEQSGIVEMLGRRELTIRDLVSVRQTQSDAIEYVRQVSHTNAAAVVPEATSSADPTAPETAGALVRNPDGGYKPEGDWRFERKTTNVVTIAEWVPATKRALADVGQMEGLINDELRLDIKEAEENQILLGDGSGENLTGIMNTSGVQSHVVEGTDDLFASIRKGITKARVVGRVIPNGIVVSPEVAEVIDLAKDANERYYFGGPQSIGTRTLWGLPVIESEAMPNATALLGDFRKAVLWDREQTTVTFTDSHADFFIRNMVAILAEERLAFGVTRAPAFVKVGTGVA